MILLASKENSVRMLPSDAYDKSYILHIIRETTLAFEYDFLEALKKMHEEYRARWGDPPTEEVEEKKE